MALIALAAAVLWPYRRFAGDDAYIEFRYALNLANDQGFSFNPGQPTYGATAPLWIALLAGAHRLGASIPIAAHVLNAACVLLTLSAFWLLCRHYLRRPAMRGVAAALLILDPWFVRWVMSGMENALALFLLCAALLAQQRGRGAARASLAAPICVGLGVLTRPEFAVLAVLLMLDTLAFEPRPWRKAVLYGLVMAVIVLPWLAYAQLSFGSILPATVTAKMGAGRLEALGATLKYFGSFYIFEAAGIAACLAIDRRRLLYALSDRVILARWALPVAWMIALPLFYTAGSAPISARYLLLGLPAYLLIGVKAWELLLSHGAALRRPALLVGALATSSVSLVGYVQYRYCWYLTRWPEGMDGGMLALGRWLRDNTRPGEVISTSQVGVFGFYSGREILDSAGLVSPEMQRYIRVSDSVLLSAVRRRSPQWLITMQSEAELRALDPGYESLQLVGAHEVHREGGSDAGKSFIYNLYRTNWPVAPRAGEAGAVTAE